MKLNWRWTFILCLALFTVVMAVVANQLGNEDSFLNNTIREQVRAKDGVHQETDALGIKPTGIGSVNIGDTGGDVVIKLGGLPRSTTTSRDANGSTTMYYYESGMITLRDGRVVSVYSQ